MKKALFVLIPSLIFAAIIFLLINNFILRKNERGALQVTSAPPSDVYLNDELVGQTPLCKCEAEEMVPTGEYTIRLVPKTGEGKEFQETITIEKSVLTVVDRTFAPGAASEGSIITLQPLNDSTERELLVQTVPDQAEVLLDSASRGFTPLLLRDITESDHELTIRKSGYSDKKVRVHTPSGYKLIATIYLGVDQDGATIEATPTPTSSPSATPSPDVSKVTILSTPVGFLRVRSDATISSEEIGRVNPGESYELVSEQTGWFQIRLDDGQTGWISSQYASREESQE